MQQLPMVSVLVIFSLTSEAAMAFFNQPAEVWRDSSRDKRDLRRWGLNIKSKLSKSGETVRLQFDFNLKDPFLLPSCRKGMGPAQLKNANCHTVLRPLNVSGFAILIPKDPSKHAVPLPQLPTRYIYFYPTIFSVFWFSYMCDYLTDGGGWIVIQRRINGKVDFRRNWNSYRKGFGTFSGDFWLGNDRIHKITSRWKCELRVDIMWKGKQYFAHYSRFYVGDERSRYVLKVGGYSGNATNSMAYHNNGKFSTYDRDNDRSTRHCGSLYGAWWHKDCYHSNLNADVWTPKKWFKSPAWILLTKGAPLSYTEMKIRVVP